MSFDATSRKVLANVWINGSSYPVDVRNINYRTEVNANSDVLLPGCVACALVDIKIHAVIDEDLIGLPVRISFNAFDNDTVGGSAVTRLLGEFLITGQENIKGTGATIIHATDVVEKLDKTDYISELIYPASTLDMAEEAGLQAGVTVLWDRSVEPMMVQYKPEGYTCRDVLGYIAGMYGKYVIDAFQVSTSNVSYSNAVVLRDYTNDGVIITPSLMHRGGLEMKTVEVQSGVPTVYVESKVTVVEGSPGSAPEGAPVDDIRYIQNPDELKDAFNFLPYWVIVRAITVEEGTNPEYTVHFTEAPTTFSWVVTGPDFLDNYLYEYKSPDGVASTYATNYALGFSGFSFEWLEKNGGLIQNYWNDYILVDQYQKGKYSDGHQTMEIIAANYDVYSTGGGLILAKNDELVGSLRKEATEGDYIVTYGEGDYTNPFIDEDNVAAVQAMQKNYTCWPGTVKWKGDPRVRPGTIITIIDRNGISIPFLICSLQLSYDGGMYMVAECHGSAKMFDKNPGVQRELKQIRAMKSIWEAANTEG